jgi:hypothetical protein
MRAMQDGSRLHLYLLYGAYTWLFVTGMLQFTIDVLSQWARGKRSPGVATTLYYGLNTSYALSQVLFAALALFAVSQGLHSLGRMPGLLLGFAAALCWLAICVLFLEYWQPRMTIAIFVVALAAVALT